MSRTYQDLTREERCCIMIRLKDSPSSIINLTPYMMAAKIDQLVMLLSTDWFNDYWKEIGVRADNHIRKNVKEKCRKIVDQIFDGESNYWMISFSEARIRQTSECFENALAESKMDKSDNELLQRIVNHSSVATDEARSISLLENCTELLAADTSPDIINNLSLDLAIKVATIFRASEVGRIDFGLLCVNSSSDWDKKIRGCTEDLPEYLADFVSAIYDQTNHFVRFWAQVAQNTSLDERHQLLGWYNDTAKLLIGFGPVFPLWMA